MDVLVLFCIVFAIAALVWAYRRMRWSGIDKFWAMMVDLNKRHGTAFGTTRDDYNTVIGTNTASGVMAFDRKNRKIAYVTEAGKKVEILDYSFVRTWRVVFNEKTSGGGMAVGFVAVGSNKTFRSDVAIEIGTTDINRPVIRIWMPNIAHAEHANERMSILINH